MNLLFANDRAGEYPQSWYAATASNLAPFPALAGDVTVDVAIVGAGYTGLSAALRLVELGASVAVVDAHRVGFGASGRNGGQVGSGHRASQEELENAYGADAARALWAMAEDAKAEVRARIDGLGIDCNLTRGIVQAANRAADLADLDRVLAYSVRHYGYDQAEMLDRAGVAALTGSERFVGGLVDWGSAHLHPLRYAQGLAKGAVAAGARIFENTHVRRIERGPRPRLVADTGTVTANHVVLAANGYLGDLDPSVAARVMPINNFIVATEPLGTRCPEVLSKETAAADSKFVVNYWRLTPDRRLLFGGGENYTHRFPTDIGAKVRPNLEHIYPQLKGVRFDYAWGGTLAITVSRMPFVSCEDGTLWSAAGYSGHGVALATLCGRILAEALHGDRARFDLLSDLKSHAFPGGSRLRAPILALALSWYGLRDRLGV